MHGFVLVGIHVIQIVSKIFNNQFHIHFMEKQVGQINQWWHRTYTNYRLNCLRVWLFLSWTYVLGNPPVAHDYMFLNNDYFNVIYKKELNRILEIMLNDFCWHMYNIMMISLQYWNSMDHTCWKYDFPLMVDHSLLSDKPFISLSHIWQAVISITQHHQSIRAVAAHAKGRQDNALSHHMDVDVDQLIIWKQCALLPTTYLKQHIP